MVKRVVLLTNFIPPYRLPLYKALADRVPELQVLISTPMEANRNWQPNWEGLNVTVQRNLTLNRTWRHPHGFSERIYVHIPYDTIGLLYKYRPDVIISGEMGLRTLQSLIYTKLNPQTRLIMWGTVSEYSEQGRGKMRENLRRWLLPQADAMLVNGKSGSRYVRKFGVPEEKTFFAPYTTEISPFVAVPLKREEKHVCRLLYVGQLVERKGIEPFMATLRQWGVKHSEKQLEFWLLGDGSLRNTIEELSLPPNVSLQLLGSVAYTKLPQFYQQADIFVFPTLADEWGLVVNEAMAAGLPVLGSLYSQSVEELVIEGETGWIFRPDRPEEMLLALERAVDTPTEVLRQMRVQARQRSEGITPEFVADRFLEAINYVSSN